MKNKGIGHQKSSINSVRFGSIRHFGKLVVFGIASVLLAVNVGAQTMYTISTTGSPSLGGGTSGGGSKASGTSASVSATPNLGYFFINWTENGAQVRTTPSYSFTVS